MSNKMKPELGQPPRDRSEKRSLAEIGGLAQFCASSGPLTIMKRGEVREPIKSLF